MDLQKYQAHDVKTLSHLEKILESKPFILDVRTKNEYCSGHVCSSINLETPLPPLNQNMVNKLHNELNKLKINKDSLILVYCKIGKRAGFTKYILNNLGYKNVLSIGGVNCEPLKSLIDGTKKSKYISICYCKH